MERKQSTENSGALGDIRSSRLLYIKAGLFVLTLVLCLITIFLLFPSWQLAILLGVVVWCCSRLYYFAFYVVEHYIDSDYRFSSLYSFVRYLIRK